MHMYMYLSTALEAIWTKETEYLEAKIGKYELLGVCFHSLKDRTYITDQASYTNLN